MSDRFFVEQPIQARQARLVGTEAHHLAHVMRAKPGDGVVLFDGTGAEFDGQVNYVGRSEIILDVGQRREVSRELPVLITLGVALPKGERQRWLVEKAVELGVARFVPLLTARGNARETAASLAKLRRAVIEASKQCGRNRLMELCEPRELPAYLEQPSDGWRWLAHPPADTTGDTAEQHSALPDQILLAIGPEGGFCDAEVALAIRHDWRRIGLGPRILRVETAAIALVARCMLWVERSA
jgi:16S rRNA (uracil1498-N3)-methyltransferase